MCCITAVGNNAVHVYPREFLLLCGNAVNAEHLPDTWPDLCATFRGVCLTPVVCGHCHFFILLYFKTIQNAQRYQCQSAKVIQGIVHGS
jgi:hypothetical protein